VSSKALAPEILALRARGSSYREITQALNECSRPSRGKEITLSARPWSSLILRDHILGEMIYEVLSGMWLEFDWARSPVRRGY